MRRSLNAQPPAPTVPRLGSATRERRLAVGLGVAGAAVSAIGSWIPSFWGDEAASVMSASRPLSSLLPMLVNIDAVHGAYYLFLHGWILLFGASEFATRLPSALAAGLTVAGLTLLASRLGGPRVALFAGITCAVLPRLTLMGTEARPYAMSAACAVWLTLLFVRLIDERMRPPKRGWMLYGIGLGLSIYVFLYLALMLVVHLVIVLSVTRSRPLLRSFGRAAGAGLAIALPVIVLAVIQRNQVSFLAETTQTRLDRLLIEQWFGNEWFAALAWLLIAAVVGAGVASAGVRGWVLAPRHPPNLMLVALCWLFVPWVVLLLLHSVIPLYSMRYLTFTAPAAALLIGMAVAIPSRRFASWLLVAAVIGTSLPSWVQQREPHAKNGSDWRQVAAMIGASASTGDGVLFQDKLRSSLKARSALHLYPDQFAGLHDLLLDQPYHRTTWLWDDTLPLDELPDRIGGITRVWVVTDRGSRWAIDDLEQLDFRVVRSSEIHRTSVHELIRASRP